MRRFPALLLILFVLPSPLPRPVQTSEPRSLLALGDWSPSKAIPPAAVTL